MKRQIVKTKDDSSTLFVPGLDEHYHSIHGALQESKHVFIEAGLQPLLHKKPETLNILEVGFGTGLNAFLTLLKTADLPVQISYFALEKYPVTEIEIKQLNYAEKLKDRKAREYLLQLHQSPWETWTGVLQNFKFYKHQTDFRDYAAQDEFHLIYFDAFAPSAQPELWTITMFENMFSSLKPGGVLLTYCVKGEVRRSMKAAGFKVEKIPGPPGKREMARAWKEG